MTADSHIKPQTILEYKKKKKINESLGMKFGDKQTALLSPLWRLFQIVVQADALTHQKNIGCFLTTLPCCYCRYRKPILDIWCFFMLKKHKNPNPNPPVCQCECGGTSSYFGPTRDQQHQADDSFLQHHD